MAVFYLPLCLRSDQLLPIMLPKVELLVSASVTLLSGGL